MPRIVAETLVAEFRRRIGSGEWAALERLPPERDLARTFGVARNTVRRAVAVLKEDGTVVRQVGRGTFVQSRRAGDVSETLAVIAGTSPADMMEVRRLLEPAAAGFAAINASTAELNAVAAAHYAAAAATDMPGFEHWDAEFHHQIFACSRNDFLKELHRLMHRIRNQAPWFEMKRRSFSEARRLIYRDEHQILLDALLRRDPENARAAMDTHLATVQRNLLGR